MARWKLTEKHYLNVPGTKWELMLTDRITGRPQRKVFNVPLYLDPEDEAECNRSEGFEKIITVCHEGKGHADGRDIIFVGSPTPGMLPIDDEAKAITATFNWTPTAGTDDESKDNSFQAKLLLGMIDQMAELQTKATSAPMGVGFDKFMESMTQMMAQQTQILAAIAGKSHEDELAKQAKALGETVKEEVGEPLEDAEPTEEEIAEASRIAAEKEAASIAKATAHAGSRRR